MTSWFAIALDEIKTRRFLREKADCKQSTDFQVIRERVCKNRLRVALLARRDFHAVPKANEGLLGVQITCKCYRFRVGSGAIMHDWKKTPSQ